MNIANLITKCQTGKIHNEILNILRDSEELLQVNSDTLSKFVEADQFYQQDIRDIAYLEHRYQLLDINHRNFLDDYIACIQTAAERYSELSYLAGLEDAVKLLQKSDLPK